MSIAVAELMNQLNQTSNNVAVEETNKAENKGISNFAAFPWLHSILRSCREALGTRHPKRLDGLLYAFVKELSFSIKDCYSRPNRAAKLRSIVHEILVYFDMIYQDLKTEYADNNSTYLHLMTDLLSIYLDLEIKVSKRGVDSLKKIGQLMTSALYTYLGHSEEHILEAILKAKLITKSAAELCAPVLQKVLSDSKCFIADEHAYVRFLLGFKLLQKLTKKSERRMIIKMATRKLDPAPELIENIKKMNNIFPLMNATKEPITSYLMNAKFDFIKAKLEFLRISNISNSTLPDFYSDKSFGYNHSETICLLNRNNKKEECQNQLLSDSWFSSTNDSCSSDFEMDPSDYRISLSPKTVPQSNEESEEENTEVEFIGTQNKLEKPVVLVTLDSDEEAVTSQAKDNAAEVEITKDKESANEIDANAKKKGETNNASCVSDSVKVKLERDIPKTCNEIKAVPESGDSIKANDNSSTKQSGGEPPALQSPEHGTINFADSIFDDGLQSSKAVSSNSGWDEGRTEVTSSLDFISSTTDQLIDDSLITKDCEISSTLEHIIENLEEYTNYPIMKDSHENLDLIQQQIVEELTPVPHNPVPPKGNDPKDAETCPKGVVIDNLDKLITTTTTKKVNYENVAKSYKIVKSNRLKNPVQNPQINDGSEVKQYKSPPKFIKIDQSGYIGSSVKDGVKWVSKNIDFRAESEINRLAFQSAKSNDYRVTSGGLANSISEQKNAGNRFARTSQCVPIIFKKLSEEPSAELKRKQTLPKSQRTSNSKSGGRRGKSHSKTAIKTDINMKSTLKHINPDSIPQFAAEAAKEKKRKYQEDPKPEANKVIRVGSAPEHKPVEVGSVAPDKFFDLKSNFPDLGYVKSNNNRTAGSEGVTNESCLPLPYAQQMNAPYFPVQSDRANTYLSTPQVDTTVDNVDLSYRDDNFNQFSQTYTSEIVSPSFYSKKANFMSYQNEQHQLNPFEKLIADGNVQNSPLAVHLKVANSVREESRIDQEMAFEARNFPVYCSADTTTHLPVINCDGLPEFSDKEEMGNESVGSTNEEEIADLVGRGERFLEVSDNHGRMSGTEVGMTIGGVRCPAKRDLIISETSEEELRDVDEELRDFCEPWEGPRDYFPDDEEYILRALPDHQNLFSEDDFSSHLFDGTFPPANLNLETVLSEDMDITVFDDKCLYDLRGDRELDGPIFESMSNENFFAENNRRIPDGDAGDDREESCKKTPENKPKSRYKEGNVYTKAIHSKCVVNSNYSLCNLKVLGRPNRICVCFRCSYRRRWLQYYGYILRLRAVRMKELKRLHEADRLKLQDDELLRRIEESLKRNNTDKTYASLPLKKRIRKKMETESYSESYQTDKFPSYPIKPMISIAELQIGSLKKDNLLNRVIKRDETAVLAQVNCQREQTAPVKTPKSPISSSETENSQPQIPDSFDLSSRQQEDDCCPTVPPKKTKPKNNNCSLRKRKTRKKRKREFRNVR
ncbi:UNVERIFIED_CONTAM: hypothetical protein PYX00_001790 [Menopon gallinae]|uniref:Uncharacterized protein n=1 Tax=Menopon gallinae TaxID=328185 RepID=A0AAW2IF45_9NEOP